MKKISEILSVKFQFLVVKFSIYLNRRVFVMFSLEVFRKKKKKKKKKLARGARDSISLDFMQSCILIDAEKYPKMF